MPPPVEQRELQALVRRLEALLQMRQMEQNRLEAGVPAAVQDCLKASLTFLDEQIATLKQRIREHIDRHPDLKKQRDLLTTIPASARGPRRRCWPS